VETIYSLQDDFGWLTIDSVTGDISVMSTPLIKGKFPIVVIEDNEGDITNHLITLSIYKEDLTSNGQRNDAVLNTINHGEKIKGTATYFNDSIPKSPTSVYSYHFTFFREKYGSTPMEVALVDTENSTITQILEDTHGISFNAGINVYRTDEWKLWMYGLKIGDTRRITIFDPETGTFDWDAIPIPNNFYGEEAHMTLAPIDRHIYINGTNNGYIELGKINTTTRELEVLTQIGNTFRPNARAKELAVGQNYIYNVIGNEPNQELYQTTFDGLTTTLIASTVDQFGEIQLKQDRWGVVATFKDVVSYADGDYFIYDDKIELLIDQDNTPWTSFDGIYSGYGPELYEAVGTLPVNLNNWDVDVNGTGTIDITSGGVSTVYDIAVNVFNFPIDSLRFTDGNTLTVLSDYNGNIDRNTTTNIDGPKYTNHTAGTASCKLANGDLVFTGYPSQGVGFKKVGETISTIVGYAGGISASTGHHSQGIVEGADGLVYVSGCQYRTGESATLAWFNPNDFYNTLNWVNPLIDVTLQEYAFNNCLAMGNKIIIPAYIISGSSETNARVFEFDTITKTFTNSFIIGTDILNAGFIVALNDDEIMGVTGSLDSPSNMIIYRLNIKTGVIVYKKTYSDVRNWTPHQLFPLYNPTPVIHPNGYMYVSNYLELNIITPFLLKINPENGGIEGLGSLDDNNVFEIDPVTGSLYIGQRGGSLLEYDVTLNTTMQPSVLIPGIDIMSFPNCDGDEWTNGDAWINDASAGTWTFNNTGSDFMYIGSKLIAKQLYELTVTIDSLLGVSYIGINFGAGRTYYFEEGTTTIQTITTDNPVNTTLAFLLSPGLTDAIISQISIKPLIETL